MVTPQHYVWAGGHFILLVSALKYLLSWALFRHPSAWWYKAAFTGALASYAIVSHKSIGTPQPNAAFLRRAIADENTQYLLLAFVWWSSRPVAIALVPFVIFSLFHALTFTRTTIMPRLLPSGPPATEGGAPTPHPLAKKLQVWVKTNYDKAMRAVAYAEVAILVRVSLGVLLFMNSFILPIFFAHFIRMRYFQSPFTKESLDKVAARTNALINRPDIPPVVKQVYSTVQALVGRFFRSAGTTQPGQPTAGGR